MPTIRLKQDILSPEYIKTITLSGYHPSELLRLIPDILMNVFRQRSPSLYEDKTVWDVSEDPTSFEATWRIKDSKDKRTSIIGWVAVQGKQSQKDMNGKVSVFLRCWIETSIKFENPIERAIIWMYDELFYKSHRLTYIEAAKMQMIEVEEEIKRYFGAMERKKTYEIPQ